MMYKRHCENRSFLTITDLLSFLNQQGTLNTLIYFMLHPSKQQLQQRGTFACGEETKN